MRDDAVVARENAVLGLDPKCLAVLDIGNRDGFIRAVFRSVVGDVQDRAVEAKAHVVVGAVELAVVELRVDQVLDGLSRRHSGNHTAHDLARERSVSVRHEDEVHALHEEAARLQGFQGFRTQNGEPRHSGLDAFEDRDGVRTDAIRDAQIRIEESGRPLAEPGVFGRERLVTHALHRLQHIAVGERLLEFSTAVDEGGQGLLFGVGQGQGADQLLVVARALPGGQPMARDQGVGSIAFAFVEDGQRCFHRCLEATRGLRYSQLVHVEAQVVDQALRLRRVFSRILEVAAAAAAEHHRAVVFELVAPRMATEIVVVVEEQDPFVLAGLLLIEVGRCESADAGSDHDEVVLFVEVGIAGGAFPIPGQGVGHFVRSIVVATEPGERRRIVVTHRIGRWVRHCLCQ